MKIRLLEKELKKSGYQRIRNGKGSHRIFKNPETCQIISLSGKKGKDVKPYQIKFIK